MLLTLPAKADPLRVSACGVFTSDTPVLPFSAPGAAWSFAFVVDRNPVPILGRMLVNGVEVGNVSQVVFYRGSNGAGRDLVLGDVIPNVGYPSLGARR
jgi:hypothetical protein